jgi:hypothetical protein
MSPLLDSVTSDITATCGDALSTPTNRADSETVEPEPPQTSPQTIDPILACIVDVWPTLPAEIQAAMAAIAKANRSP